MAAEQFVLVPRPSVRAFAVAAVTAAVGAVLTVLPVEGVVKTVLVVLGVLLIIAAAALIGAAFAVVRHQRVVVSFDDDGFRVNAPSGVRTGAWSDVTLVTTAPGRITLHRGDEDRIHLVAPQGQTPQLDAVARSVGQFLDASRGYRTWEG